MLLVVIALVGSVAIPARQTWLISGLLHQTTQTLAPARLLSSQLHAGLAEELALLRVPSGITSDSSLARFQVLADSDDRRMDSLAVLAQRLDGVASNRITALQSRIRSWRTVSNASAASVRARELQGEGPMRALVTAHRAALDAVSDVAGTLDDLAAARDRRMGELDRTGLGWNIILVIAAFGGLAAVALLMAREHQSLADSQARTRREIAMREDARAGRDRLERVLGSRSRLIRGFSHDVKNPIGAADGYAALLAEGIYGDLTPAQRESVQRIRRSIHIALGLINDLHELAAAETGHLELKIEPVDLKALIAGLVDDYSAAARGAGIRLEQRVGDDAASLYSSGIRVRQILANLISNAIKYAERGAVTVGAQRIMTGPDGDSGPWIRIDVADEGPGIPPDKHGFIFEEFGRIAPGTKSGAGLGLAISRLLAEALGGRLTVASVVGTGSTFTLWLPMRRVVDERGAGAVAAELEALPLRLPQGTADGADARPHRIEEDRERQNL
jgi:signal transduction histidine kinase